MEPLFEYSWNGAAKGGVLWRNLVNIDSRKCSLATFKQINWLYTDVADDSVDEAVQKVIEVSKNATRRRLVNRTTQLLSSSTPSETWIPSLLVGLTWYTQDTLCHRDQ